jgi:hypothetical protein
MIQTRKQQKTTYNSVLSLVAVSAFILAVLASQGQAHPAASGAKRRIYAQVLVESTVAKHAELAGLELATTPPDGHDCTTIAATDVKEMGDKCDQGELAVMKTGKPTVEKESDGYDVTLPLHASGKTIGIIGMDFKLDQKEAGLVDRAKAIAKEMEDQIPAKSKLFEAAK